MATLLLSSSFHAHMFSFCFVLYPPNAEISTFPMHQKWGISGCLHQTLESMSLITCFLLSAIRIPLALFSLSVWVYKCLPSSKKKKKCRQKRCSFYEFTDPGEYHLFKNKKSWKWQNMKNKISSQKITINITINNWILGFTQAF